MINLFNSYAVVYHRCLILTHILDILGLISSLVRPLLLTFTYHVMLTMTLVQLGLELIT